MASTPPTQPRGETASESADGISAAAALLGTGSSSVSPSATGATIATEENSALQSPAPSAERGPHRVSLSSLQSLGSAIQPGGDRIPSTGTSSVAGSFKSSMDDAAKNPAAFAQMLGSNTESAQVSGTDTPSLTTTASSIVGSPSMHNYLHSF